MTTLLEAFVVVLVATATAAAEPRISIETDPALFALHGAGFSIGASASPHWHVQLTELAADLYGFATPAGFHARMNRGTFFWLRYYARADNAGWFAGVALDAIDWRYTRADTPGDAAFDQQLAAMPFGGYRWFPTRRGLYVLPWAGVAVPFAHEGDRTVGTMTYAPKFPVFPLVAIHVGWEFGR